MFKEISSCEIQRALNELSLLDSSLAKAIKVIPVLSWQNRQKGFPGLVRVILGQQLSTASAKAIWNRLESGLKNVEPKLVLEKTIDELKNYGLSTPKARYIHGIAEATLKGTIDFEELNSLDCDTASSKLLTLKGIGRWTAESYLLWCEGRTDLFPAGDIALQEALRILDGANSRLSTEALYLRSEKWSPYRSFAAHLLWSFYCVIKPRKQLKPTAQAKGAESTGLD